MKVKYQKVHNPSSLEMQFENQRKYFKKSQIPPEGMDFYFIQLQSQNLLEIHYGLLGIKHTLYYNDLELDEIQKNNSNLMILLLNFVQKDLRPEITMRSLSILKDISQSEPLLFLRIYGVQTLLQAHLIRNSGYFIKIITILSNVSSKSEERERFRQVGLITMIIDFITKSFNLSVQSKLSNKLRNFFNSNTDQSVLDQIREIYEECLLSNSSCIKISLISINDFLRHNKIYEINQKVITHLFSMYQNCENSEQQEIIQYLHNLTNQKHCNFQLLQFGLFDFIYSLMNSQNLDIRVGMKIIKNSIGLSTQGANQLASHEIFQYILANFKKIQQFHFLFKIIKLISFSFLQTTISNGFLRFISKYLQQLTINNKYHLNTIEPILQFIIDAGKANLEENYFLIEIQQLGIIESIDSARVFMQFSQAQHFQNDLKQKLMGA